MEIALPAVTGAKSIALYWIPATVRPVHGVPPPPPVDLSGRLGILYLRRRRPSGATPSIRRGICARRIFTMIVARNYAVVLDTVSPDAFPVRLTHIDGAAIARLEKLPADPVRPPEPAPETLRAQLEGLIRAWLAREGLELSGDLVRNDDFKLSRSGAAAGYDVHLRGSAHQKRAVRPGCESRRRHGCRSRGSRSRARRHPLQQGRSRFVFLGLSWDRDGAQRADEMDLMIGSLRLLRRKPTPASAPAPRSPSG
jgi:hypothetical protein